MKCTTDEMTVEMILPETVTDVYLEGMKEFGKQAGKSFLNIVKQFYYTTQNQV